MKLTEMFQAIEKCQKDLTSAPECEKLRALCNDPKAAADPSSKDVCIGALAPLPAAPPASATEEKKSFPWKPVLIGAGVLGAIGLLFAVAGSSSSEGEGTEET